MESHLLQMRGLKHHISQVASDWLPSHLLQMRGLKHYCGVSLSRILRSRIFYRCVD